MPFEIIAKSLPRSCVTIARYAEITAWSECAIWGVNNPDELHGECDNPIWSLYQRNTLLRYLSIAQSKIEDVRGYPLCKTYIADEEHPYAFPIHAKWVKIIEPGVRAETVIDAGAPVDYTDDPAQVGPIATALTDESEIRAFYPNSEREIEIEQVEISSGFVTLWIPRCRMVKPELFNTPAEGLDYTDTDNFLETVDVKRVYTDNTVNAQLVYSHRDSEPFCPLCGCLTCGEVTTDACLYVRNPATGALDALRAVQSGGTWTARCSHCYCARPDKVRVNYVAGMDEITEELADAVVRLSHSLMPVEPCSCDVFKSIWVRDTHIPDFVSAEREAGLFGISDGAMAAYKIAKTNATMRAGVL